MDYTVAQGVHGYARLKRAHVVWIGDCRILGYGEDVAELSAGVLCVVVTNGDGGRDSFWRFENLGRRVSESP